MTTVAIDELCKLYYDEQTYAHARRVAKRALGIASFFKYNLETSKIVYNLGLAHDLYEDTDIKQGVWFDNAFEDNLQLLTKKPSSTYEQYITGIKHNALHNTYLLPAYIVKLADIADHFEQKDTLTDRLKEKYIDALPYLLKGE